MKRQTEKRNVERRAAHVDAAGNSAVPGSFPSAAFPSPFLFSVFAFIAFRRLSFSVVSGAPILHYSISMVFTRLQYSISMVFRRLQHSISTAFRKLHNSITVLSRVLHYSITVLSRVLQYSIFMVFSILHYSINRLSRVLQYSIYCLILALFTASSPTLSQTKAQAEAALRQMSPAEIDQKLKEYGITREEAPYWYEPATYPYNTRDFGYWTDIATCVDRERRPTLDRRLLRMQKSSLFDCLLGTCAVETRAMIAHLIRRRRSEMLQSFSMFYDLLTRSYPSVFYLTFNASVWRLPEKAQLLGGSFGGMNTSSYLSQSEIAMLPQDTIANIMSAARLREARGRAQGWLP